MPIKAENRSRYPANWPAIRAGIMHRAGWRCEHPGCGVRNYSVGWWQPNEAGAQVFRPCLAMTFQRWGEARAAAAAFHWEGGEEEAPPIVIVLTVAHLDHQPENCEPDNLRALCQRHHLAHDREHHLANAQATRRAKSGTAELF